MVSRTHLRARSKQWSELVALADVRQGQAMLAQAGVEAVRADCAERLDGIGHNISASLSQWQTCVSDGKIDLNRSRLLRLQLEGQLHESSTEQAELSRLETACDNARVVTSSRSADRQVCGDALTKAERQLGKANAAHMADMAAELHLARRGAS